jgi:hypothetical protein
MPQERDADGFIQHIAKWYVCVVNKDYPTEHPQSARSAPDRTKSR